MRPEVQASCALSLLPGACRFSSLTVLSEAAYTHFKSLLQEVCLAEVIIGDNESFESALKRFTKRVQQDGILAEARRREHYEKPSVRRKKKAAAKRRKSRKTAA